MISATWRVDKSSRTGQSLPVLSYLVYSLPCCHLDLMVFASPLKNEKIDSRGHRQQHGLKDGTRLLWIVDVDLYA